jgi:phosphatidylglycerol:prolipoprotein diacylglycerol transferase
VHPVLFHIGSFPVRAYGTLILVGFFVALRYAMGEARRLSASTGSASTGSASTGSAADATDEHKRITPEHVFDMALFGLVAGLIGTRVVFVALNWPLFADDPLSALKLWTGGLSFIGAPIFGFGYVWFYCRRHRLPFPAVADIGAPGFALAYAFGRVGCFLNGCCYGHACSAPWAVRFQQDGVPGAITEPSHPTQLYSAATSLVIFAILHRARRAPHRDGTVVLSYFALYAIYRFANDFFRAGATSKVLWFGLTDGQIASAVAVPLLLTWLWFLRRRPQTA